MVEGWMRHDWILDVLRDLRAYAQMNGMPALATKAQDALDVAIVEMQAADAPPDADMATPSPPQRHPI